MKKLLMTCCMVLITCMYAQSNDCTKDEIKLGLPECIDSDNKPQKILDSDITLCKKEELILASSQIYQKNEKIFSICSDKQNKYLEYRFGTTEHIEFNYKVSSDKPNKIYRGTYIGGSNQTTMFWFYNGNFLYRIEIPFTGVSEINVLKNKNKILNLKCINNAERKYMNMKHPLLIDKSAEEMFEIWNL
jgi:hypothetical protein